MKRAFVIDLRVKVADNCFDPIGGDISMIRSCKGGSQRKNGL